jgi:hypothetical protein
VALLRADSKNMQNHTDNSTPTPTLVAASPLRPFVAHFVPGSADDLPDNDFNLQCGLHQRKMVVLERSPEEALVAATCIIAQSYPFEFTITRIDDESSLRDGLAVLAKVNAGELAPASADEDSEEWDRFDFVVCGP